MSLVIRACAGPDREAVNRVALAAFSQYADQYRDWPSFSAGIARMADLAQGGELPPRRGVAYGRYVLPAAGFGPALELLGAKPARLPV